MSMTTNIHINHETLNLGDGAFTVAGNHNDFSLGDGNDLLSLIGDHNQAVLGSGNDSVTVNGPFSQVTLGSGTNSVLVGPNNGQSDTITVGAGHDTITTSNGDSANTFNLGASTSSLLLNGTNNLVSVNGGTESITDSAASSSLPGGDHLLLNVGMSGGTIGITNFSTALGVVELAPNLGFSTAAAAVANLMSDGNGGSFLNFAGGQIHFHGIAMSALQASNFQIA